MSHYFSSKPDSESKPSSVTFTARDTTLSLVADSGVFSKSGLDFGTRTLIETVDLSDAADVVDLGCGYAPVAAVLARVYPHTRWRLIDVNERACQLASINVKDLGERAQVFRSDGFADLAFFQVDAILLNPPIRAGKAVIYKLFEESSARLRPGGKLWVVIQKKQGAPSAKIKLDELFSNVTVREKRSGYHVFECRGSRVGLRE